MRKKSQPARVGRPPGGPSRDERRAELVEAALAVIARVGPSASMDEIADAAGLTKPVLYRHFGDKVGMASALSGTLADRITAELLGRVAAAAAEHPRVAREPRARRHARLSAVVGAAVDAFVEFVEREPNLYRFMIYPPGVADPKREVVAMSDRVADTIAAALVAQAGAEGDEVPDAVGVLGRAVVGTAYNVAEWWERERPIPRPVLVDALTCFLVGGIEASLGA